MHYQTTLCLLIKGTDDDREILLAMKKRGFGRGKWNGTGGKLDPDVDSNLIDAVARETEEEICVKIKNPQKVAVFDFIFPETPEEERWDHETHLYVVTDWEGKPIETDEMAPKWFKIDDIPYDEMWDDDRFWLPLILAGKKLKARFSFDQDDKMIDKEIEIVGEL